MIIPPANLQKKKDKLILKTGLKITQKNSVYEKNYWKISAAHDGYLKKFA